MHGTESHPITGTSTNGSVSSQMTSDRAVCLEKLRGMGVAMMRSHAPPANPMPLTASSMLRWISLGVPASRLALSVLEIVSKVNRQRFPVDAEAKIVSARTGSVTHRRTDSSGTSLKAVGSVGSDLVRPLLSLVLSTYAYAAHNSHNRRRNLLSGMYTDNRATSRACRMRDPHAVRPSTNLP